MVETTTASPAPRQMDKRPTKQEVTQQRELQDRILQAATAEQRRIGEELHDGTLQELTGLGLLAQNLADALNTPETAREHRLAVRIAAGIAETNGRVRALAQGLVPVPVDAQGLMTALAGLGERTQAQHGIACRFDCPEPVRITSDSVALHLYRIAQEAVTNAVRHAGADTIVVRLACEDGTLHLEVRDNGAGIDTEQRDHGGLGLRIMEHRCDLMGGTFSARRSQSGGTVISCCVPLMPSPG